MENLENTKITFAKNLSKINFNTTISMPIDTNVNIKTILDINSYLFDESVECGSGKAVVTGKIGIKVLYIDTDNMTNTISYSQNFSETFVDSSITTDCYINIMNSHLSNNILSHDGTLKINCDVNISPILYLNLSMNNNLSQVDNLIVKKNELVATTIASTIDKRIDYTTSFETKDEITKILSHNAYFVETNSSCQNGMVVVEGKIYSSILFETTRDDETKIVELKDTFNTIFNIEADTVSADCTLDISLKLDKSQEVISTETEDDGQVILITNKIRAVGVAIKEISAEVIDDAFSTNNEVDLHMSSREYYKVGTKSYVNDNVSGDITLLDSESAIDQLISNLNINPEITNYYLKDDYLHLEGIITSHLTYIDENKEYQQKVCEIPFITNTKLALDNLYCLHAEINVEDCKCRVKRGTIIELEYNIDCTVINYIKETKEIVDNISIGKNLDFSQYDYQIYLAKPNETLWELCKRICITEEDLLSCNPDLPSLLNGNERIIIRR